ncbi:MAG: class I SAM-dependent methyltransferase [Alphaproteobacteria bacterium]
MADTHAIADHYTRGDLLARIKAALAADGADPDHPTIAALTTYDQFHGRGLEGTEELARTVKAATGDHILDVGSGIGGPARFFAQRFGCRITGIDLTPEFCAVARELTRLTGLDDRVRFEQGDATAMPFADAAFDGAYSMYVAMNIADRAGLYREICRVLKPGAWLVVSELAQGPGRPPDYPTPWAATAAASFLATPDATRRGLEAAGFRVLSLRDTTEAWHAFGARARAQVERGEKRPLGAVNLIHGDLAETVMTNTNRGVAEGRLIPIEVVCAKTP